MDDFPTGILYRHIFALKDQTGVSMQHEGVFLKLRNNCDTNWKKIESQSCFNNDSGGQMSADES